MKPILILTGPTAVGKSQLAFQIAKSLQCRIISADSMQIYKGLDIGTAKPTTVEQQQVKHECIDICQPDYTYSSYMFKQYVGEILQKYNNSEAPFVVGGTAFYIDSLLYKLDFEFDEQSEQRRAEFWKYYQENGAEKLHALLESVDSQSAANIHKNNVKRVIRALEIVQNGHKRYENQGKRTQEYDYILFALQLPREELYNRIDMRVDTMLSKGLVEEVECVYKKYPNRQLQSLQAIGYKEIISYIEKEISLPEAIDLIKKNSRNYAKRQITYLKRMNPIWLDANANTDVLCNEIVSKYQMYSQK